VGERERGCERWEIREERERREALIESAQHLMEERETTVGIVCGKDGVTLCCKLIKMVIPIYYYYLITHYNCFWLV
jgi:hypothetical protein